LSLEVKQLHSTLGAFSSPFVSIIANCLPGYLRPCHTALSHKMLELFGFWGIVIQISILLIVIFGQFSVIDPPAETMSATMTKLNPKTLSVGVLGYTGESGKALIAELLDNDVFKNTVLIGRRTVDYTEESYKKATQKLVDFEKLSEHEEAFKDLDVVYCCMGTTRAKAGAEGFRKVDFDYTLESARVAKKMGVKQFHLVSSAGVDKNSMFLYPQVKGQVEEAIGKLDFERLAIYHPKFLLANRTEPRMMETALRFLTRPIQILSPTLMSTPVSTLASSMLANTLHSDPAEKMKIIDNVNIFRLAKVYDDEKKK